MEINRIILFVYSVIILESILFNVSNSDGQCVEEGRDCITDYNSWKDNCCEGYICWLDRGSFTNGKCHKCGSRFDQCSHYSGRNINTCCSNHHDGLFCSDEPGNKDYCLTDEDTELWDDYIYDMDYEQWMFDYYENGYYKYPWLENKEAGAQAESEAGELIPNFTENDKNEKNYLLEEGFLIGILTELLFVLLLVSMLYCIYASKQSNKVQYDKVSTDENLNVSYQ